MKGFASIEIGDMVEGPVRFIANGTLAEIRDNMRQWIARQDVRGRYHYTIRGKFDSVEEYGAGTVAGMVKEICHA